MSFEENQYLGFHRFREFRPGTIRPEGWLLEFLRRQQTGLSGHFHAHGYPFDGCMWRGTMDERFMRENVYQPRKIPILPQSDWWPYEQTAYLLDGLVRLGILLADEELCNIFRENLDYLLAHPAADGRLGGALYRIRSEWPMAIFFRAAVVYGEANLDRRIVDGFYRHYAALTVDDLALHHRHIVNLEGVLKLYEWTGDERLLTKAVDAYQLHDRHFSRKDFFYKELTRSKIASGNRITMHGATVCEELKLPVLLYLATGDRTYYAEALRSLEQMLTDHAQPNGMISCNEYLSGRDPLQGYETCVITDLPWTLGYFIMADGNCACADRMERIAFNALPGSIVKDFSALQYLSAVNQVVADGFSHHTHYKRGITDKWQYAPRHFPECCSGNVHRAMPNYIMRMWMRDASGAPAAICYGPSSLDFEYDGQPVRILEQTNYPFEDKVVFSFVRVSPNAMPFTLRIPEWSKAPELILNENPVPLALTPGHFVTMPPRVWSVNDRLELRLLMNPAICRDRHWQWLEYGPLVGAYPVPNRTVQENEGKFSALRLTPAASWNYSLDVAPDNAAAIRVIRRENSFYPFDQSPLGWQVPVRRISNYDSLDSNRYTPEIPLFYQVGRDTEFITLEPFGSTMTRITAFPDPVERASLPLVAAAASGPHPYNFRLPLAEQIFEGEYLTDYEFVDANNAVVHPGPTGYFDLINHFETSENCLAYLQLRFWADNAGPATLTVAVADAAIGWFNNRKIFELEPSGEGEFMAPAWFDVILKAGYNFLRLKIADLITPEQYRKAWGAKVEIFRIRQRNETMTLNEESL